MFNTSSATDTQLTSLSQGLFSSFDTIGIPQTINGDEMGFLDKVRHISIERYMPILYVNKNQVPSITRAMPGQMCSVVNTGPKPLMLNDIVTLMPALEIDNGASSHDVCIRKLSCDNEVQQFHFPQTVTIPFYLKTLESIFISSILNKLKKLSVPESIYIKDYYIPNLNLKSFELDQFITAYENLITSVAKIDKRDVEALTSDNIHRVYLNRFKYDHPGDSLDKDDELFNYISFFREVLNMNFSFAPLPVGRVLQKDLILYSSESNPDEILPGEKFIIYLSDYLTA